MGTKNFSYNNRASKEASRYNAKGRNMFYFKKIRKLFPAIVSLEKELTSLLWIYGFFLQNCDD